MARPDAKPTGTDSHREDSSLRSTVPSLSGARSYSSAPRISTSARAASSKMLSACSSCKWPMNTRLSRSKRSPYCLFLSIQTAYYPAVLCQDPGPGAQSCDRTYEQSGVWGHEKAESPSRCCRPGLDMGTCGQRENRIDVDSVVAQGKSVSTVWTVPIVNTSAKERPGLPHPEASRLGEAHHPSKQSAWGHGARPLLWLRHGVHCSGRRGKKRRPTAMGRH